MNSNIESDPSPSPKPQQQQQFAPHNNGGWFPMNNGVPPHHLTMGPGFHPVMMMQQQQQSTQVPTNSHGGSSPENGASFPPGMMFPSMMQRQQVYGDHQLPFAPPGGAYHMTHLPFFPPFFQAPPPQQQQPCEQQQEQDLSQYSTSTTTALATTPGFHQHYHRPREQHQTPLQPPSHLYNGPPVSAIVPRGQFKQHNGPSPPMERRSYDRVSLGAPTGFVPTPTQRPQSSPTSSEDDVSPPPAPPAAAMQQQQHSPPLLDGKIKQEEEDEQAQRAPLSLASNNNPSTSSQPPAEKSKSSIQEASLLLGLRTDHQQSPAKPGTPTKTNQSPPRTTCFPTQVPENYPKRLALPNDHIKLNALHCFLRLDLLEVFVVEGNHNSRVKFRHAPSSSIGRVGMRCVFCAAARRENPEGNFDDEAPMAVFYPKTTKEIYRLVTSWQRCHLRKCKQLPPPIRAEWQRLRHDKTRGKTIYWLESAQEIGLRDANTKAGGIHFKVGAN